MANLNAIFVLNTDVEVDGNELGDDYKDAWVKGVITEIPDQGRRVGARKDYSIKLQKDNTTVRKGSSSFRPSPVATTGPSFRQGKLVEYLKQGVWWKSRFTQAVIPGATYEIKLLYSDDLETVSRNLLREPKEWSTNNIWA